MKEDLQGMKEDIKSLKESNTKIQDDLKAIQRATAYLPAVYSQYVRIAPEILAGMKAVIDEAASP